MLILTILHARNVSEYLNHLLFLSTWVCFSVCVSSQPGCWRMCSSCRNDLMVISCHVFAAVTNCLSVCLSDCSSDTDIDYVSGSMFCFHHLFFTHRARKRPESSAPLLRGQPNVKTEQKRKNPLIEGIIPVFFTFTINQMKTVNKPSVQIISSQ